MSQTHKPVTRLCTHTLTSLHYRDADLVQDLMGKKTFTEVMLMQILGRTPRAVDMRITDVVLIVLMEHVAKDGSAKIVYECSLPLTGRGVVDMLITDLAVFDIDRKAGTSRLIELAPGVTLDEVKAKTAASFTVDLSAAA